MPAGSAPQCWRSLELLNLIQVVVSVIALWFVWRSHARSSTAQRLLSGDGVSGSAAPPPAGYCSVATEQPSCTGAPARLASGRVLRASGTTLALTVAVCSQLMVAVSLDAQSDAAALAVAAAAASAAASTVASGPSFVSEEQVLADLVPSLTAMYLTAYNLFWTQTASSVNPFTATQNQCLSVLQKQSNQIQYEQLSGDLEAYAALGKRNALPPDVQYALTLVWFVSRVRIMQAQNATLDLSAAVIYTASTGLVTLSPQFLVVALPHFGPQTKALLGSGASAARVTPTQLATVLLASGEHPSAFEQVAGGKAGRKFICGSA